MPRACALALGRVGRPPPSPVTQSSEQRLRVKPCHSMGSLSGPQSPLMAAAGCWGRGVIRPAAHAGRGELMLSWPGKTPWGPEGLCAEVRRVTDNTEAPRPRRAVPTRHPATPGRACLPRSCLRLRGPWSQGVSAGPGQHVAGAGAPPGGSGENGPRPSQLLDQPAFAPDPSSQQPPPPTADVTPPLPPSRVPSPASLSSGHL